MERVEERFFSYFYDKNTIVFFIIIFSFSKDNTKQTRIVRILKKGEAV